LTDPLLWSSSTAEPYYTQRLFLFSVFSLHCGRRRWIYACIHLKRNNHCLYPTGAKISASDISDSMANEAARRAKEMGIKNAKFYTSDLESVTGKYDTVTCVDVAIHYPTDKMSEMVEHLCSLSNDRVIISFAPKTWYYVALKKVGELFPGPSKTTRAYLHEEKVVRDALKKSGFEVAREEMTATNFYFSRLLEAKRV